MKLRSILVFTVFSSFLLQGQEGLTPLSANLNYLYGDLQPSVPEKIPLTAKKPASIQLPFLEDFYYASRNIYPDAQKWMDRSVYVNTGFGIAPPSIGVATFDGLNQNGYPYFNPPVPNLNDSGPADTLTSQPINLFTNALSQTLTPQDSIGLSFHYQPRGYGELPEANDSLIVDLYKPRQQKWEQRVWFSRGVSNVNLIDTAFKRGFIFITDTAYFADGFRFRFRNKATNTGNFDHWNVDYILLDQNRSQSADPIYNDVTFAHVPTSFLRDYSAMPWQQYNPSEMANNNSVWLKNNYTQEVSIYYDTRFYDKNNSLLYTYSANNSNIPPFKPNGYFANPAFRNPAGSSSFTFDYPALTDSSDFTIKHYVFRSGTSTDWIVPNDTVYQFQRFRNYYAYDDGSPEAGYYVLGAQGKMVTKFRLNVRDTLRALRIYFDPAPIGGAEKFYFRIKLYNGTSVPGQEIFVGNKNYFPKYHTTGFKTIPEYELENPIVLDPGTYFIGIQQQLATGLVVGFDRNYDSHTNLYYDSGSGFEQSGIKGSLMLRPVLGKKVPPPVGMIDQDHEVHNIILYPNPNSGKFYIQKYSDGDFTYELFNTLGQKLGAGTIGEGQTEISAPDQCEGLHVVHISKNGATVARKKILIQK